MAKLANYVRRTALVAMMAGVFGLWGLQLVFAYLGEIENLNDSYKVADALWFIAYRSPYFLSQFMPTGVLLGAVIGLGLLANNSELTVMRSAGISVYKIVGWALQPAFLFVLLALSLNQWVLPVSQSYANAIKSPQKLLTINGYWTATPTKSGTGQQIIYIESANANGNLGQVKRFVIDDGTLVSAMNARSGSYAGTPDNLYQWQLQNVNALSLHQGATTNQHHHTMLSLPIAKDSIALLVHEPDDMSISALYAHARLMSHQGTHSPKHALAFWQKLLSPFAVISLVLVACSFVFGSLRSQSLGLRIVIALLVGLLFSYAQDLVGFMALAGNLPPLIMVLIPIVLVGMVGLVLIAKKG